VVHNAITLGDRSSENYGSRPKVGGA
jgi:hypothetical protein